MMGERRMMQEALFYGFSLERHVPEDHLLRKRIADVGRTEETDQIAGVQNGRGRLGVRP